MKIKKCVCCKTEEYLQVHHIDKDKDNNKATNLMCLCQFCHKEAHSLGINKDKDRIKKEVGILRRISPADWEERKWEESIKKVKISP